MVIDTITDHHQAEQHTSGNNIRSRRLGMLNPEPRSQNKSARGDWPGPWCPFLMDLRKQNILRTERMNWDRLMAVHLQQTSN